MGVAARKIQTVKSKVHALVREQKAVGNTGISNAEFASIQLNLLGRDAIDDIVLGTGLLRSTIERFMDFPENYDPKCSTENRILVYLGLGATYNSIKINKKHQNVEKSVRLF